MYLHAKLASHHTLSVLFVTTYAVSTAVAPAPSHSAVNTSIVAGPDHEDTDVRELHER